MSTEPDYPHFKERCDILEAKTSQMPGTYDGPSFITWEDLMDRVTMLDHAIWLALREYDRHKRGGDIPVTFFDLLEARDRVRRAWHVLQMAAIRAKLPHATAWRPAPKDLYPDGK